MEGTERKQAGRRERESSGFHDKLRSNWSHRATRDRGRRPGRRTSCVTEQSPLRGEGVNRRAQTSRGVALRREGVKHYNGLWVIKTERGEIAKKELQVND